MEPVRLDEDLSPPFPDDFAEELRDDELRLEADLEPDAERVPPEFPDRFVFPVSSSFEDDFEEDDLLFVPADLDEDPDLDADPRPEDLFVVDLVVAMS